MTGSGHSGTLHDLQANGPVRRLLIVDSVTTASGFDYCLLRRIGLKKAVEMLLFAPVFVVNVVADDAG
jgi:hypothetical protein